MTAAEIVFAEEARIVCSKALVKLANGNARAVKEILTEFGQKCVKIVQGAKMTAEDVEDLRADRYDLGALKVDMRSESPEREED